MHAQDFLIGSGPRLDKVLKIREAFLEQLIAYQPVFLRRKDVLTKI